MSVGNRSGPGYGRWSGRGGGAESPGSRFLRRAAILALLLALFLGVPVIVVSPSMAEHFLFFPDRRDVGRPPPLSGVDGRRVSVTASDGVETFGWFWEVGGADGAPAPVVLLLHGNAGSVAGRTPLAGGLVARGLSVLLLEYRGYGGATGEPTIDGVVRDARAGLERVASLAGSEERTVLFGRSLGGAVGMQALEDGTVGAVILESTFTSLEAIGQSVYPIFPDFVFRRLRGVLDTRSAVVGLRAPLLVVHGTEDGIVPFRMGVELHDAAPEPKAWHPVRGAGHNDVHVVGDAAYFDRLADFVREHVEGG